MTSIVVPIGYSGNSCGYCGGQGKRSEEKDSYSYGFWAVQLTCKDYKDLVDSGWRRSGAYVYNPDRSRTCCPQYTIKLDVAAFKPPRSIRQELHRFNKWIITDQHPSFKGVEIAKSFEGAGSGTADIDMDMPSAPITTPSIDINKLNDVTSSQQQQHAQDAPQPSVLATSKSQGKSKGKNNTFDLLESVHEAQQAPNAKHKLEVHLERASYTDEKFELFKKYQIAIHHETISEQRQSSFKGFLVDGPLKYSAIRYEHGRPAPMPSHYGQYHQMYRVDGKLIAMGVVDVLPGCVSSVYLMYDPVYHALSLGKISALFEVALASEMRKAGAGAVDLYMGYYIHDCVKMKYKASYQPSYLLDAESNRFYPYQQSAATLDKHRWASFARGESIRVEGAGVSGENDGSDDEDENLPSPPPAGFLNPRTLSKRLLNEIKILDNRSMSLLTYFTLPRSYRPQVDDIVAALGEKAPNFVILIT